MRVTPRDANYTGPGSRFCILRPELITSFCHVSSASKTFCFAYEFSSLYCDIGDISFCKAEAAERSKSQVTSEMDVSGGTDSLDANAAPVPSIQENPVSAGSEMQVKVALME